MTAAAVSTARRLLDRGLEHPVVTLLFDLDPDQFATPPARETQLRSLIDGANKTLGEDESLSHDDRKAVVESLERLQEYLQSDEAPVQGARALAVYCSVGDDLLEAVRLSHPVAPRVVIAQTPYVEPLVAGEDEGRWCVTLVSRRMARIFDGEAPRLRESGHREDGVHGQHSQGGWSQARYERSYEGETDHHLRDTAEELYRLWQRQPFDRLILGGPEEIVSRFVDALHNDLRPLLSDARITVDVEVASPADVRETARRLRDEIRRSSQEDRLAELEARLNAEGRAVAGVEPTLGALNERRVEALVLALNFSHAGVRCPSCGLLYPVGTTSCPADGTTPDPVEDLREATVEAAVLQDADVAVIGEGSEVPPAVLIRADGIGALLRF